MLTLFKRVSTTTLVIAVAFITGMAYQARSGVSAQGQKVYELRTYTTAEGRLPALLKRFGGGEIDLFIKHGMTSVAYWVPDDEDLSKNTMVYMVGHDSREAAAASWEAFGADPEWTAIRAASVADGPIVTGVVNQFLNPTDFSPLQ